MKTYKYFMAYNYMNRGQLGFGNVIAKVEYCIKEVEDVIAIQESIREENDLESVVIMNYILIEKSGEE